MKWQWLDGMGWDGMGWDWMGTPSGLYTLHVGLGWELCKIQVGCNDWEAPFGKPHWPHVHTHTHPFRAHTHLKSTHPPNVRMLGAGVLTYLCNHHVWSSTTLSPVLLPCRYTRLLTGRGGPSCLGGPPLLLMKCQIVKSSLQCCQERQKTR